MRRLLRILSITLIVTASGCSTPSDHGPRHYTDLATGFEVDYPNGWQVGKGRGDGEFVFSASAEPGAAHCWVNAERVDPRWMSAEAPTLDTFAIHLYLIKRHREARNAQYLDDRMAPLSGYPARHFSVRFDAPLIEAPRAGGPARPVSRFQTEVSVVYAKDRPFVLGCTALATEAGLLQTATALIRASFRPMR